MGVSARACVFFVHVCLVEVVGSLRFSARCSNRPHATKLITPPRPAFAATLLYHRQQARTESLRLLSTMLAIPSWRRCLDLDSQEAVSLTAVLLKEEAEALNRAADGESMTEVSTYRRSPPLPAAISRNILLCQLPPVSTVVPGYVVGYCRAKNVTKGH